MNKLYSRMFRDALLIAGIVLFCTCFSFIKADVVGSRAVYDSSVQRLAYDKDAKKSYICNVIKVTFGPFRLGNEEDKVRDYVGGSYYKDPADENSGYIVLPGDYTLAELTNISDNLLYEYDWLEYAGYVLD